MKWLLAPLFLIAMIATGCAATKQVQTAPRQMIQVESGVSVPADWGRIDSWPFAFYAPSSLHRLPPPPVLDVVEQPYAGPGLHLRFRYSMNLASRFVAGDPEPIVVSGHDGHIASWRTIDEAPTDPREKKKWVRAHSHGDSLSYHVGLYVPALQTIWIGADCKNAELQRDAMVILRSVTIPEKW